MMKLKPQRYQVYVFCSRQTNAKMVGDITFYEIDDSDKEKCSQSCTFFATFLPACVCVCKFDWFFAGFGNLRCNYKFFFYVVLDSYAAYQNFTVTWLERKTKKKIGNLV